MAKKQARSPFQIMERVGNMHRYGVQAEWLGHRISATAQSYDTLCGWGEYMGGWLVHLQMTMPVDRWDYSLETNSGYLYWDEPARRCAMVFRYDVDPEDTEAWPAPGTTRPGKFQQPHLWAYLLTGDYAGQDAVAMIDGDMEFPDGDPQRLWNEVGWVTVDDLVEAVVLAITDYSNRDRGPIRDYHGLTDHIDRMGW